MKKIVQAIMAVVMLFSTAAFAIKVDEKELEKADDGKSIVFENFTAKNAWINSLKGIKNIGVQLGWPVAADRTLLQTVGNKNRYAVVHAIDPSEKEGFDADVVIIGTGAAVDHINNVRHIIASYLTAAYNYTDQDAYTIAILVTVYNGLYRGDLEFFGKRYKAAVLNVLTADKCGLSLSYKDWPGGTQIVIPLSDGVNASLNSVDIDTITDKKVLAAVESDPSMLEDVSQDGDTTLPTVDIKTRVDTLKKRAKSEEIALGRYKKNDKLWVRVLLFCLSVVVLLAGLFLLVLDIITHKKIDEASNKDMLLSSTETSSYISHLWLKKLGIIAGCALNIAAFVMSLLALMGLAFTPPDSPFIIAISLMLAVGVAGVIVLGKLIFDLDKRLTAVSMAHINPPGADIPPEEPTIGDPVVVTASSNDPALKL